jgi:(Z)-2-((N-methylformamido)methylene)-5-hydroxybutyrolactone dehydrogenase
VTGSFVPCDVLPRQVSEPLGRVLCEQNSYDPYAGKPWALVARGGPADVDAAASAAHAAFTSGDWPKLKPTQRGVLLRRLGDLVARDAEKLAALEVRDNGKLIAEMGAQLRYLPQWYHYYGGLADKIEGSVIPIDKADVFNFTRHEPVGCRSCSRPGSSRPHWRQVARSWSSRPSTPPSRCWNFAS